MSKKRRMDGNWAKAALSALSVTAPAELSVLFEGTFLPSSPDAAGPGRVSPPSALFASFVSGLSFSWSVSSSLGLSQGHSRPSQSKFRYVSYNVSKIDANLSQ